MFKLFCFFLVLVFQALTFQTVHASNASPVVMIAPQKKSIKVKAEAYELMRQLTGWCSEEKAGVLIDLITQIQPEIIVEIGVYGGKSLVPMAHALRTNGKGVIYGIDPWSAAESIQGAMHEANINYWGRLDHNAILSQLLWKIQEFGLKDQIVLIPTTSANADPIEQIDILHIDGNHSDATSYLDVTKWAPLVKKGGWIIFDDMTWCENGIYTTARAVEWLNTHCVQVAEFSDNCDWGIWIKL